MKPNGLLKRIKGFGGGDSKRDHHIRVNNRKVGNWWEDCQTVVERGSINHSVKVEIESQMQEYNEVNQCGK